GAVGLAMSGLEKGEAMPGEREEARLLRMTKCRPRVVHDEARRAYKVARATVADRTIVAETVEEAAGRVEGSVVESERLANVLLKESRIGEVGWQDSASHAGLHWPFSDQPFATHAGAAPPG